MTARLPFMGVTLIARNFNTYTRQLQQAQRVTFAASGGMVDAAKSAQMQVAALNQLSVAQRATAEATRLSQELAVKQADTQRLATQFALQRAEALSRISTLENKNVKALEKTLFAAGKRRQQARLAELKQEQISLRTRIAALRTTASESRNVARQITQNRKQEAIATREATAATRQYAAAQAILGAAMLAVGIPLVALTKNFITAAAEAERFMTAADITTAARGITPEDLAAERKEMDALFISTARANRTIQQFAIANLDARKSSEFLQAGLDFSTTSYLNQTRVLELLTQAVTSGNVTRLRELGLSTNLGAIHQWYADILGKEEEALTAVEEKQAVLNYIFRIAQGVQGAWAAQLDKTTGLLQQMGFNLGRIREILGEALLPVVNDVIRGILTLLEAFRELPAPVQKIIAFTTALSGILLTIGGAFLLLKPAIGAIVTAVGALTAKVAPLVTATATAAGAKGVGGLVTAALALPLPLKVAAGAVVLLVRAIQTNFGGLGDLFKRTFGALLKSIRVAFVDSIPWIRASISILIDVITFPFRVAFQWLDREIRKITGKLAEDGWGFEFDAEETFVGAASIMGGMAAGLIFGFNQFVLPVVIDIVDFVASFLGGSLPTKGPLAHIETSGIEIIQAWSQGMKSVSLDDLRDLADEVDEILRQAMFQIQDTLFDIQTQELQLDKVLRPFEDALFLIGASVDLITIPLEQQTRELERQITKLEEIAKIERERAEAYLKILEDQAEAIQEIIDADEERLEVIDHEIFIEEQRLKIMGQTTSVRLLELRGQKRLTEDNIKDNKQSLSVTEDQVSVEEERLETLVTAAEAQIEALQAQVDALNANIELEEERVLLAQEALRIEEARQAQARLALLEESRFWEEEQRLASHYLDIIGRIPAEEKKRKDAVEAVKKSLGDLLELAPVFTPEVDAEQFGIDIDALKDKLINAFMAPVNAELRRTRALIDGELTGETGGPEGERRGGGLKGAIDRLRATFETPLEIHFEILPTGPEVFEWGKGLGEEAIEGFFAGIGIPGFGPEKEDIEERATEGGKVYLSKFGSGITGGVSGEIVRALDPIVPAVANWIDLNAPKLESWRETFLNFSAPIPFLFPPILEEKIARPLRNWIFSQVEFILTGHSPGGVKDWGQAFLDFPSLFVTDLLVDSLELITAILLPWISPDAELRIIEDLITWGNAFLDWVAKDATPFIAERLDVFMTEITRWMDDDGNPTMYAHGEDLADSLVEGLEDATTANKERLEDVGVQMLQGIKDGLDDEFDDFERWLRKKLQDIIDAVEGELGIKSPSTVFANIGTQMVLGMEVGFEREADSWADRGLKQALAGMTNVGEELVQGIWGGAQEEWPRFEAWLLDSIYSLAKEVRFEMGSMMSTVVMTPQASSTPTVNNFSTSTTMNISPNYARVQSVASIRDDVGMMMALRR